MWLGTESDLAKSGDKTVEMDLKPSILQACQGRRFAVDPWFAAVKELDLCDRADLSREGQNAVLNLARVRARELWRSRTGPTLLSVLEGVYWWVFVNQYEDANDMDERWFLRHPDRQFRKRMALPHEAHSLPAHKIYGTSSIVVG